MVFYIDIMSIGEQVEKFLIKLGKDNKPTLVAISVATAKGIFRPIFTMADKKQDKETKKYTATRECLTEIIAIPVYWGSGVLSEFLSKKLAKPKDIDEATFKKIVNGDKFENPEMASRVKGIRKNMFKMRTTLSMLGVFLSAGLLIPAICSVTIKPLMNAIQKKKTIEKNNSQTVKTITVDNISKSNNTSFKQIYKNQYYNKPSGYFTKVGEIW